MVLVKLINSSRHERDKELFLASIHLVEKELNVYLRGEIFLPMRKLNLQGEPEKKCFQCRGIEGFAAVRSSFVENQFTLC